MLNQSSVEYAKANKLYCRKHKWYVHLCRVNFCEYWGDCYKALVGMGYELIPDKRKDNPTGLRWQFNKKTNEKKQSRLNIKGW